MTRIGLISDVHASCAPLLDALAIFRQQDVKHILCAGDIAGYGEELEETIQALLDNNCQSISGNHDIWYLEEANVIIPGIQHYLESLPESLTVEIESSSLCMVHARPPCENMGGIHLLDDRGNIIPQQLVQWKEYLLDFAYDILVVGHTHQVFAQYIGNTLVINPGSTKFNHSCAILSLPEKKVEFFALSGSTIRKSWNWGVFFAGSNADG